MRLTTLITLSLIGAFYLNFLAEDYFTPDPCAYHVKVMEPTLSIFYSASGASGGHPSSSLFTNIITIVIGVASGIIFNKFVKKTLKFKTD
jgi:hypothetical protein